MHAEQRKQGSAHLRRNFGEERVRPSFDTNLRRRTMTREEQGIIGQDQYFPFDAP
jgi:hypothetical protein